MSKQATSIGPLTYRRCTDILAGGDIRTVAPNTFLVRQNDNTVTVIFHSTEILSYSRDGFVTVTVPNQYRTVTTKQRLNAFLGTGRVYAKNYTWYLDGEVLRERHPIVPPLPTLAHMARIPSGCEIPAGILADKLEDEGHGQIAQRVREKYSATEALTV